MSICGYGFNEPEKEICGDEVPAGQKYCAYHSAARLVRSCGHSWGEHPYLFDHELRDSDDSTLAREERLHPCRACEVDDQQHALGQYREDMDSGYYDRDPRDYL